MRASDLLGLPVLAPGGHRIGEVIDVRLVQTGALRGASDALRVEGFVIGHHQVASRLGYDRYERPGPWLVRVLVRRLARRNRFLAWADAEVTATSIRARTSDLPEVPLL